MNDLRPLLDAPPACLGAALRDALLQDASFPALLQRNMQHGSIALLDDVLPHVLRREDAGDTTALRIAVHYTSLLTGCACENDPTPISPQPEYVELRLAIRKADGAATLAEA